MAVFGDKLARYGLVHSQMGNMSARFGKRILISRSGSMLDELTEDALIEIDLSGPGPDEDLASSDSSIHRAIYQKTSAKAVIHAHSPYAVAESLITLARTSHPPSSRNDTDSIAGIARNQERLKAHPLSRGVRGTEKSGSHICIISEEIETKCLLHEIPIVPENIDHLAKVCADVLSTNVALLVRGHGTIAVGATLKEAYLYICSVEHACKVRNLCRRAGVNPDFSPAF